MRAFAHGTVILTGVLAVTGILPASGFDNRPFVQNLNHIKQIASTVPLRTGMACISSMTETTR